MKKVVFSPIGRLVVIQFLLTIGVGIVTAQTNYYFYVQFANKKDTPYSLLNPSAFLSQRAIDRRATFKIPCDSADLPINPSYISQITSLGIQVHNTSKWMNGATLYLSDSSKMTLVRAFPFVKFVEYTGKQVGAVLAPQQRAKEQVALDYGIANTQIAQLNGKVLHNLGYLGKGIQIGVIDAGFTNVNINPAFDSLRLQGRLLGTKDIINPASNIYAEDAHGANVLSIITGNLPGQFLGTAPKASFWLIRTEYSPTEYKVETDFWTSGIEFADSVGIDIVTSSLGYYTFEDSTMGFSYVDMTGKVSRASRAATIASKKGIVVLVAAGNEGAKSWHYIGSPADVDGIFAVGAVTSSGAPSSFTSFGPSFDGRTKPEICAMGTSTAIVNTAGTTATGNGTSYATPVMAGMMACLLQLYKSTDQNPSINNFFQSVIKSGNLYSNPTAQMGYGIPDFAVAINNLSVLNGLQNISTHNFVVAYNNTTQNLIVRFSDNNHLNNSTLKIYSITGQNIYNHAISSYCTEIKSDKLIPGIYFVAVTINSKIETQKFIVY